jgi:tetratricopeptide (TPR) repeat protein
MFFALGLMAKSMLVTFPVILLLLDFWPLERDIKSISLSKIFLEKIPFFILTAASAVITIAVMKYAGHVADAAQLTFKYRIANVLFSYVAYIHKMFWPAKLAPFYPHPGTTLALWKAVAAAIILLVISVIIIYWSSRRRYLLVGWLWYLITLSPVIGFLQIGSQAMADRYTYIPLVGLFIIISFAVADLLQHFRYKKPILIISTALITFALVVCTNLQVRHWRNSISLFEHTLKVTSNNYLAHNNLANALGQNQNYDAAIGHCLEAIRIRPKYYRAHYNLGMVFYHKGDMDKAVSHWTYVLQLNPVFPETNYNIAIALLKQNKTNQAIEHLKKEIELNPNHIRAQKTLSDLKS